jgi:hypothetical protein
MAGAMAEAATAAATVVAPEAAQGRAATAAGVMVADRGRSSCPKGRPRWSGQCRPFADQQHR